MHVLNTTPPASDEVVSAQLFSTAGSPDHQVPDAAPPTAEASTPNPTEAISAEHEPPWFALNEHERSPKAMDDSSVTVAATHLSVETIAAPLKTAAPADLPAPDNEQTLLAEIARLWAEHKVNRLALGEKLFYLKDQAKHGTWLKKVEEMGLKDRTVRALIRDYEREAGLVDVNSAPAEDESRNHFPDDSENPNPRSPRSRASHYNFFIALEFGPEEKAWKAALDIIVASVKSVENRHRAVFYAVIEMAKQLQRQQDEQATIDHSAGKNQSELPVGYSVAAPSLLPAIVAEQPAPEEIDVLPGPVYIPSPRSPRKALLFTMEDEEVL
jgi:hypothetical protein